MRMGKVIFILAINASFLSVPVFAGSGETLENFTPGHYTLMVGSEENCGDDTDFGLRDNGRNLNLGTFHGLNTYEGSEILKGDAPGDEACSYEAKDEKKVQGAETVLTFSEIHKCGKKIMHHLVKKAFIKKNHITLKFERTGEEPQKFECVWELK